MPKSIHTATPEAYSAGDLLDAHSLSLHNYEALEVLANTARIKLLRQIEALQKTGFPTLQEYYFRDALKLLEIAEETSSRCGQQSKRMAEQYEAEHNASRQQEGK